MFGSFSIPWSIISLAATNLDRHSSRCCAQGLKNLPVHDMGVHGDKIYGLFGLISHRPDPVISPDYSLATAEVYRRAVLTLLDTPSSFSVLMGTLGKHSYPTIERQTNRNHSPTTSSIATSVSIPNGSNGGASAGSHAYCTKCGLGPLFELKNDSPIRRSQRNRKLPITLCVCIHDSHLDRGSPCN
jgi:hypothetical protein